MCIYIYVQYMIGYAPLSLLKSGVPGSFMIIQVTQGGWQLFFMILLCA